MNTAKLFRSLFWASMVLMVAAIIALAAFQLKFGIDFTGGSVTELEFQQSYDIAKVRSVVAEQNIPFQIQSSGERGVIIKTGNIEKSQHDNILAAIKTGVGEFNERQYTAIGPVIGKELSRNAFYQFLLVSVGIILYIAFAFRRVTRPITSWQFGAAAIIALIHDLLIVLGVFALLGHFYGVEVDSMFVTAMLTVLGFSVHDTIVVFDRIRENLKLLGNQSLQSVVNLSISQTMVRSLNTSLTVIFVLSALLLFGGETIRYFVLALLIGIVAGTYSSIFVASPILVYWQNWRQRRAK